MPEKIGHPIDGIEEYDNPVPRWLMWLLYVTMAVSAVYWVLYPGFWPGASGWNQAVMYEREMAEASAKFNSAAGPEQVDIAAVFSDAKSIDEGRGIFSQNCAPCHGADAKGAIGPNLTDGEWLYGSEPARVVKTVTEGTDKGMPPWKSQLGPKKIAQVAAYVSSLSAK